MPDMWVWWLLYAALAAALTAVARRYALHRQLVDQPGERRSHTVATPRGGGISIVIAMLVATVWLACLFPTQHWALVGFGTGLTLVAGIGWVDDHRPLSPWSRLAVHVLAALLLAAGMLASGLGPWVAMAAALLALGLVNVWNFMDGIDGLAASQALLLAAVLAWVLPGPWNWLAAALAAAVLGFLPFNFPKARIFLGDVGSGALGYALAMLLALSLSPQPSQGWLLSALLPAAFIVDAGFTLAWRMLNGERWWTPHVQHAYQRWARRAGHVAVSLAYALCTLLLLVCFLYGCQAGFSVVIVLFIICYTLASALWWCSRRTTVAATHKDPEP